MKKIILLQILLFITIISIKAFPQAYENSHKCTKYGNSNLKKFISIGYIPELIDDNHFLESWASSFIKQNGNPPQKGNYKNDDLNQYGFDYDKWTCMHSAYNANDKKEETAWVSKGTGEVVIVKVDITKPIKIRAGNIKSQILFNDNNRPKKIKIYIFVGKIDTKFAPRVVIYKEIRRLGMHEILLKDLNGYQELNIPTYQIQNKYNEDMDYDFKKNYMQQSFIAIEILSVYKGNKTDQTYINEVNNVEEE